MWWRLVLLLLVAGCSASPGTPPSTTTTLLPDLPVETAPASTTSTVAAAFAIPAVIDVPYVQRVLEEIYHLDGEATRHAYAIKAVDDEADERLKAIFGGESLSGAQDVLRDNADDGFSRFADPPADPNIEVIEIVQATQTCLIMRANLDFGPYYRSSSDVGPPIVIQLGRAEVLPFNPTGWGVLVAGAPDPDQNLKVCK